MRLYQARAIPLGARSGYDLYLDERERCRPAADCDFVLVNLFAAPLGAPMRYSRVRQLFAALSRRAGLSRAVTPHMLRHAAGSA
jgi:site-specific recombinase XerD